MLLLVMALSMGLQPARAPAPGDVIVFFELTAAGETDTDIHAQRISVEGKTLWGDALHPVAVAASRAVETSPVACDDGAGGAIVAYRHEFRSGDDVGDTDIVAQRIDRSGKLVWSQPVPVGYSKTAESDPVIVSDGQGGAIIAYRRIDREGDSDVLAQRISGAGKLLWNNGEKPVVVAGSPEPELGPALVSDGLGGVIVVFDWVNQSGDGDMDVMAQHISADGKGLWNAGERATNIAATKHLERHPVVVTDGSGGAIVVFELEYTSGQYKGDADIHAQRISREGKVLWGSGESMVVSSGPGIERNPVALADGTGGVLVVFEFEAIEGEAAGDTDVLEQRLDGSGEMLWNGGDRSSAVSTSKSLERLPALCSDGAGGAIVTCESELRTGDRKGDNDIVAQRISPDGTMGWLKGERSQGVATSIWHERRPIVLSDGQGGAICVYTAIAVGGEHDGDMDIEAAGIGPDGALLWSAGEKSADVAATKRRERSPFAIISGAR